MASTQDYLGLSPAARSLLGANMRRQGVRRIPNHVIGYPGDGTANWVATNGTLANDSANVICSNAAFASMVGRKLTKSAACTNALVTYTPTATVDFTIPGAQWVRVRVFVHKGSGASDWRHIRSLNINIFDGATPSVGMGYEIAGTVGYYEGTGMSGPLRPGWNTFTIGPSAWSNAATFDWSVACKSVVMKFYTQNSGGTVGDADATPAITFGSMEFFSKPSTKARLALTFDDGQSRLFNELALLNYYGIPATCYISPSKLSTSAVYMTQDQLYALQEAGHLIANHGWQHVDAVASFWDIEQVRAEFDHAAEWLAGQGFYQGARHIAIPGGSASWLGINEEKILGPSADSIRLTSGWPPYSLPDRPVYGCIFDTEDLTDITAQIDLAVADKGNLVAGLHGASAYYSEAQFATLVADIAGHVTAGDLECVTIDRLLTLE